MFKALLIALLLGVAIVALVAAPFIRKRDGNGAQDARALRVGAAVVLVLTLIFAAWACTFRVGAKQYGVLTTFGHPSGSDYGSGIHTKWPWQKDVTVDGKVKTFGFTKDTTTGFDEHYTCVQTVIGNGTPSCVDVTVRWQVAEDQASVLYANYGTSDPTSHFGQAVIHAQLLQVIPIVMRTYNPITQLKVISGKASGSSVESASFAPDYDALSKQAQQILQSRLSGEATIQSIAISSAPLDPATQQKLSQFIQEQAKTRTALQAIETNKNVAQANKELQKSLQASPGLLVSKCLDELGDAITKDYALPAGFSCFGSGSVVVPGVTK